MSLTYKNGIASFSPGFADIHGHPRVFDPITDYAFVQSDGYEGKAGLAYYTAAALKSGFVLLSAMPNEFYRVPNPEKLDGTEIVQFPIATPDRARLLEMSVRTQAYMQTAYFYGIERASIISEEGNVKEDVVRASFMLGGVHAAGLKLWVDESTGGQEISPEKAPAVVRIWHELYQNKPVIMHAEDQNVRAVLESIRELPNGHRIPIHIAHVSSQQELEAVMWAKEAGMDVTCEVTPHHLFVNADDAVDLGGYGCMKPSLKRESDVRFLRDNIRQVDIFASDCAPHKLSEKESEKPAFGVTNHTTMVPLFLGAVEEGWLGLADLHGKLVANPRKRFNLPMNDKTQSVFDMRVNPLSAEELEHRVEPMYGQNIMCKLEEVGKKFHLVGRLILARSGSSEVAALPSYPYHEELRTDLRHLVTVR